MKEKVPNVQHIILIGYSYGSVISSSCASEIDEVIGYCAIR
jgi:alpha/beta superfamily hydrolase